MGWEQMLGKTFSRFLPQDQFQHAAYLIEPSEMPKEFSELIDKHMMLGNIDDDIVMRLYQTDLFYLVKLYEMSIRDPALRPVFNTLWVGFLGEIAITRNKKAMERQLQAFISALRNVFGYGRDIGKKVGAEESGGLPSDISEVIYVE